MREFYGFNADDEPLAVEFLEEKFHLSKEKVWVARRHAAGGASGDGGLPIRVEHHAQVAKLNSQRAELRPRQHRAAADVFATGEMLRALTGYFNVHLNVRAEAAGELRNVSDAGQFAFVGHERRGL